MAAFCSTCGGRLPKGSVARVVRKCWECHRLSRPRPEKPLCACGCGLRTRKHDGSAKFYGRHGFIGNRQNLPSHLPHHTGAKSANWKGGVHVRGSFTKIYGADGVEHRLHRELAAVALGRPLKANELAFRVDAGRDADIGNIAVGDRAYMKHIQGIMLLRSAALAECGDPDKRKCVYCLRWDSPDVMRRTAGWRGSFYHPLCRNTYAYAKKHGEPISPGADLAERACHHKARMESMGQGSNTKRYRKLKVHMWKPGRAR